MTFQHPEPVTPILGFVLLAGVVPEVDAVASVLADEFEQVDVRAVSTPEAEVPTVVVRNGDVTLLVAPVAGPVPQERAAQWAHPAWWRDASAIGDHASHLIVTTVPDETESDARALSIHGALTASVAAALLCELPEAVGYFAASAGLTVPADAYAHTVEEALAAEHLPVELWTSVWLEPRSDVETTASVVGLDTFGHADLFVPPTHRPPSEVYGLLTSLAAHVVSSGERLGPGMRIAGPEGEFFEVTVAPRSSEEHPLLAIAL